MQIDKCQNKSSIINEPSVAFTQQKINANIDESEGVQSVQEIRQPDTFKQSTKQIKAQRAAWCAPPDPSQNSRLTISGKSFPVPFPTVCFDQDSRLRHDSPLPLKYWWKNISSGLKDTICEVCTLSFSISNLNLMLEPARWISLWTQGNFQLCAGYRPKQMVDSIILHWDGCNSSAQMYYTLRRLGLSAHLLIDADGTVYQMLDLGLDKGFHAGWINERSIGIELSNPVDSLVTHNTQRAVVKHLLPNLKKYSYYLDFTEIQKKRTCEVIDFLTEHFNIPKVLPPTVDVCGGEKTPKLVGRDFSGVCGHYHVSEKKEDPGLSLWPIIRNHWST